MKKLLVNIVLILSLALPVTIKSTMTKPKSQINLKTKSKSSCIFGVEHCSTSNDCMTGICLDGCCLVVQTKNNTVHKK